jgi:hypothetical protein
MRTSDIWNSVTNYLRRGNRKTDYNSRFVIGGALCSEDSFVLAESSVLHMDICDEKPAHRKSAKR